VTDLITGAQAALFARDQDARPFRQAFVVVLDGDITAQQVCWRVAGRLPARFRQQPSGWPVQSWADDPLFDLQGHVRHTQLARGQSLEAWIERRLAMPSDRAHPLWQVWLVGLPASELKALVVFCHPALVDAGEHVHLLDCLADSQPGEIAPVPLASPAAADAPQGWTWGDDPASTWSGLSASVGGMVDTALRAVTERPAEFQVAGVEVPLDDVRAVARAFGCTVHDVVVALAAGGVAAIGVAGDVAAAGPPQPQPDPVAVDPLAFSAGGARRVEPVRMTLPVGVAGAGDRLDAIATLTRAELDAGGRVPALELVGPGMGVATCHALAAQSLADAGAHTAVVAHAPGTREQWFVGLAAVRGVTAFLTPTNDETLTVCATGHGPSITLGATGLAPLAGFGRGVLDGLDTLVSLAGRRRS